MRHVATFILTVFFASSCSLPFFIKETEEAEEVVEEVLKVEKELDQPDPQPDPAKAVSGKSNAH